VPCDQTQTQLHGYLDGELDALSAANFEKHLETCTDCKQILPRRSPCTVRFSKQVSMNALPNLCVSVSWAIRNNQLLFARFPALVSPLGGGSRSRLSCSSPCSSAGANSNLAGARAMLS